MEYSRQVTIIDNDGVRKRGSVPPQPSGEGLLIRLEGGETVYVPRDAVTENGDEYTLELRFADLQNASLEAGSETLTDEVSAEGERTVLPVLEESLRVEKRRVERGRVRIRKVVREHEGVVDEPLLSERVEVERVAVNELVDYAPAVREEGDVTVIPIVEEVLVVEKRLLLKEEVRVTKKQTERREPQRVTLRREEAIIERLGPDGEEATSGAVETDEI